jgi:O-antigen ligase
MRRTRYLILFFAIYFLFVGGSSRYGTLYQVRVIHHIVVTSVLSLWLIHRIRQGKGIPTTPFNLPLLALIGVWLISAITSADPRMALEHMWFPLTFIVIFFIIVDYFQRGRGKIIMEAFLFIVAIVIFLTGLELASWYFGLGILPDTQVSWSDVGIIIPPTLPKVSLAMGISTLVAGFTAPAIFITATWALTVRHKSHKRIIWIIAGLLFITLILTFSRGGLLAFIGGITAFAGFRAIQHPAFTSRISPTAIGGMAITIAIGIMALFVAMTLPFAIGKSDEGRLDMWQSAVNMTIDNPITGVGPGLFGRAYREYRDPIVGRDKLAAAHNLYLNVSSELGLLGILVGSWLAVVILQTSWKAWRNAKGRNQHLRVEGMFAALIALAIHSTVDVFTITSINIIFIVIIAYLISGHRSILDPLPTGQIRPAYALLGIIIIFGGLLLQWDRAQGLFQSGFNKSPHEALDLTLQAQEIDPYLNLYQLHEAFLLGKIANDRETIKTAIQAYEYALQLEPTWDIGWINLAWLELKQDNRDIALDYLQIAHDIYPSNSAIFALAYTADTHLLRDESFIINAYLQALRTTRLLPLAEVWWDTPRSIEATETYLKTQTIEYRYRAYRIYRPELAQALISTDPQTAMEWWIVGQVALGNNELQTAEEAFTNAINLKPNHGDYYVSRAQTRLNRPKLAKQDLQLAALFGTRFEYPDTLRAMLAETTADVIKIKANALPNRSTLQEFAGVLYTRPAVFDIPKEMRFPGLGETVLTPWYEVAEYSVSDGDIDQAIRVYQFILENAPYESRAQAELQKLAVNQ